MSVERRHQGQSTADQILQDIGFVFSLKKLTLEPLHQLEYVGLVLVYVFLPPEKDLDPSVQGAGDEVLGTPSVCFCIRVLGLIVNTIRTSI